MLKKVKVLLLLISLSVTLCLMSNTYSRYVASSTNNVNVAFAKWQLLVNNNDITNNTATDINITPTIESNSNVADGKVAPSSKGYFDVTIDPTNVDVSFDYSITLDLNNKNLPDLMITKYAIIPEDYKEGDILTFNNIQNGVISNTMDFDNNTESFAFNKFTVRICFEWFDGQGQTMNDADDTKAQQDNSTFNINATLAFSQKI